MNVISRYCPFKKSKVLFLKFLNELVFFKNTYSAQLDIGIEVDTPFTSIILAFERDIPCTSILLKQKLMLMLEVNDGMPGIKSVRHGQWAFLPVFNCFSPASTFLHQGHSGTVGHGFSPALPTYNFQLFYLQ
jgi:hypothetical protein